MNDDFAILILTHGRADNVMTTKALEKSGYTGKIYYVIATKMNRKIYIMRNMVTA